MKRKKRKPPLPSETYIGIDPGANGAMVALIGGKVLWTEMPDSNTDILDWLESAGNCTRNPRVVLEQINPGFKGSGKAAMSKLYGSYTKLQMACSALELPTVDLPATKWHRLLSISPRKKTENDYKWKGRLRDIAQRMYPKLDLWGETQKVQRAVADALLIATVCKQQNGGN